MKIRIIKSTQINKKKFKAGQTMEVTPELGRKLIESEKAESIMLTDEDSYMSNLQKQ